MLYVISEFIPELARKNIREKKTNSQLRDGASRKNKIGDENGNENSRFSLVL